MLDNLTFLQFVPVIIASMTQHPKKVFLIFSGYNQRAVLALCRALERMGQPVAICASSSTDSIFRTSWHRNVVHVRPTPALEFHAIEQAIQAAKKRFNGSQIVIAPSSEALNRFLFKHRQKLSNTGVDVPLVEEDIYCSISDKSRFRHLCLSHDIPVPEAVSVHEQEPPLVAKPKTYFNARGQAAYPILIHTQRSLQSFTKSHRAEDYYFEKYIDGENYYLLYHFSKPGTVYKASQRNIAQQADGKSIVLAKTANLEESDISHKIEAMLQSIGFHGLAMVEIFHAGDGRFYTIEINPRLWGPSQLLNDSHSPVLDAFIQESLELPNSELDGKTHRSSTYLWLGGALNKTLGRSKLRWHTPSGKSDWPLLLRSIPHDVLLRRDSLNILFGTL